MGVLKARVPPSGILRGRSEYLNLGGCLFYCLSYETLTKFMATVGVTVLKGWIKPSQSESESEKILSYVVGQLVLRPVTGL